MMQNPRAYIEERLSRLAQKRKLPTFKNEEDPSDHIVKTILSKKFRKWAVDQDFLAHLENAVKISLEKKEPIKFVMPFGGYKLWRLDESPEADWAELFTMMFYTAWLKPIADAYEPGVWFDFSSDDVVVERMNRISKADTESYKRSFEGVIAFLEHYIPENIRFTFTPVGSRYAPGEFNTELNVIMARSLQERGGELPEVTEAEKKMMDLNARKNEDDIADPEWYGKNKLMHDSYMTVSKRRPYTRAEDKILTFTRSLPKGVAVGTTKTSIAKFWVGVGALQKRDNSYIETILSPSQIEKAKATWEPVCIDGLEGKNFTKIRVVD